MERGKIQKTGKKIVKRRFHYIRSMSIWGELQFTGVDYGLAFGVAKEIGIFPQISYHLLVFLS